MRLMAVACLQKHRTNRAQLNVVAYFLSKRDRPQKGDLFLLVFEPRGPSLVSGCCG
jgi:hypothetical protein